MRARRTIGNEGMGLGAWLGIAAVALVILGAVGLTVYGGSVKPAQHPIEQVVPDDHLPR
jgi:hypothetical protein